MKKYIIFLIIALGATIFVGCNHSSINSLMNDNDGIDAVYKPMINIDGVVYILTEDYYIVGDKNKLQKIGVIEKSLSSPQKYIKTTDDSWTSNVYKVGTEIFTLDGQIGIIAKVQEGSYSLLQIS